jgi:hypothetical protein
MDKGRSMMPWRLEAIRTGEEETEVIEDYMGYLEAHDYLQKFANAYIDTGIYEKAWCAITPFKPRERH